VAGTAIGETTELRGESLESTDEFPQIPGKSPPNPQRTYRILRIHRQCSSPFASRHPPPCTHAPVSASAGTAQPLEPPYSGLPARCSVQGFLIEELMPQVNFRPGYSMWATQDIEDKGHLVPWLLAARKDFSGARYCTVLYCTVLYCTVLYCTVLYCTVLCCAVLDCAVLAVLCCTVV